MAKHRPPALDGTPADSPCGGSRVKGVLPAMLGALAVARVRAPAECNYEDGEHRQAGTPRV